MHGGKMPSMFSLKLMIDSREKEKDGAFMRRAVFFRFIIFYFSTIVHYCAD